MTQVVLRSRQAVVEEVPAPVPRAGSILVRVRGWRGRTAVQPGEVLSGDSQCYGKRRYGDPAG